MSETPKTPAPIAGIISADAIATALENLIAEGKLDPADKAVILWFYQHGRDRKLSQTALADLIGYNASTVSRLQRGEYGADCAKLTAAIRAYKELHDERARMTRPDYIETQLWREVRNACQFALVNNTTTMITGPSQVGKTHALEEFVRRCPQRVIFVRIPAAPSFSLVVKTIAEACGINNRCSVDELRPRIARALDPNTLLIIDELHQLAMTSGRNPIRVMEWIREIRDRSDCGLTVCGTRTLERDLIQGPELKAWLEQFVERCVRTLVIEAQIPDPDIRAIAAAYGLPEPDPADMAACRKLRINRYTKALRMASNAAAHNGAPIAWHHLHGALAALIA